MTAIYGLVGYPLGHSFSRNFFNTKFADEGIDAQYVNFEIPKIALFPSIISDTPNLSGLNVTIPYKQQVIPYLTDIDETARNIGAVNVIKILRDADNKICGLKGYNSDVIGFTESIKPLLKPHHRHALILGTGGASKAVYHGLLNLGITPTFVSRTPNSSLPTLHSSLPHSSLSYSDLTPEVMATHTVIVNTTPLGMYPKVEGCPDIPYDLLTPEHLCYDLVYNPEVTTFMRLSAAHGATTKNGLEMLHLQALAAYRLWHS